VVDSVNTLRGILVAGAVIVAAIAAANGLWPVVAMMLVAVVAHGLMWRYLAQLKRQQR